jgi:hypothetical protein
MTTAKSREIMEVRVLERWHMLTLDTEVDNPERTGEAVESAWVSDIELKLAYAASRLSGDGFEGDVDTRGVVEDLMEMISARLMAFAVDFRLHEPVEDAA